MKKLIHHFFLFALFTWLASCQAPSQALFHEAGRQTANGGQQSDMAVKAELISQNYCHTDLDSFAVKMNVKLRFTNVSEQPVILSRKIASPGVVRVAKSTELGKKGDFEYAPNVDMFTDRPPVMPKFGDAPDLKDFVILAAGESYETTVPTGVFGKLKGPSGHGLLANGTHVLQLGVSTWPYPDSPAEGQRLATEWIRFGHLQFGIVYSDFVPFTIPKKFDNPPCR